jgi:predicted nuclease with RNAse H fold
VKTLVGIDFGAKLAGATVAAVWRGELTFVATPKKRDADAMLRGLLLSENIDVCCIDAPLSLPRAYTDSSLGDDYFYRACDRSLGAMSPMFLGGLTARAMRLRAEICRECPQTRVAETYPAEQARRLGLRETGYKQGKEGIAPTLRRIARATQMVLPENLPDWHHVDALLALLAALRLDAGEAMFYGDEAEGVIVI